MVNRQKYQNYKDSGIEWLGEIPEEWKVKRIKTVIDSEKNGYWGSEPELDDKGIICIRVADFDYERFQVVDSDDYTKRVLDESKIEKILLKNRDLLIEKSGGGEKTPVGRVVLFNKDFDAICSNFVARLRSKEEALSTFLVYLFSHLYSRAVNIRSIKQTTGIQNLDTYLYLSEKVAIPPKLQQKQIADFLDKKTEKIDSIAEKNKKLINKLKEYKKSLISKVVTKGLDPNAKMKDSGIDWLGEIPKGWEVEKLKYNYKFEKGKNAGKYTASYVDQNPGKYPVYSGQTEQKGIMGKIDTYEYNYKEVIFTTTVGAKVMTPLYLEGKFNLSQNCLIMVPLRKNICSKYYYYQLYPLFHYEKSSIPSHTQPSLRVDDLNRYNIASPPKKEQKQIADFLDEKTEKIDLLINKLQNKNELLKEFKQSFISNVVTGKIKV